MTSESVLNYVQREVESPTEVTYIPIRVLGKGAFGEATLYRRIEDNSLVVWKEVNLSRLSTKETDDSDTEVEILSLLDHANIITYYNHFIDAETLLIEMEYANGGNLYQKITQTAGLMNEEQVVWYFYQLISAVAFIHDHDILHRDVKSLNIFLTKGGLCKLGDFGISKVMNSKTQMADSYVGTPYYMSPELIKGESYNSKSDVWACGCVLYELCTLKRVFDATNALRLASAIVQAEFKPINEDLYSTSLQKMLTDILNKDPVGRPSAHDLFQYECMQKYSTDIDSQVWKLNTSTRMTRLSSMAIESQPVVVCQSTEIYLWGGGKASPRKLDIFKDDKAAAHISCSKNHYAVISVEKELFTWTSSHGQVGQLGHGDVAAYKNPKKVESFDGIPVKQVTCGDEFTMCLADDGTLYSFGGDYYGCLAQESDQALSPTPVSLGYTVSQVSAGACHVVVLTHCGRVLTWGCGEFGRLGNGSEDDITMPHEVTLPAKQTIETVIAGPDCTFLIASSGKVLACGNNEYNKLGLNSEVRGLAKRKAKVCYDTPCQYSLVAVKLLRTNKITQISSGPTHTAAVTSFGQLLTFGSNKYGQLGLGDFRDHPGINLVSGVLAGRKVTQVSCGDHFTVLATDDNQVFACGSCKDGRLGIAVSTQNVALPRPIFGSLHAVSSICSSHWTTLLVADKVLGQKTISNTTSTKPASSRASTDVFGCDEIDDSSPNDYSTMMMSSTPAWVKQEFHEAGAAASPSPPPPILSELKLDLGGTDAVSPTGEFQPFSGDFDQSVECHKLAREEDPTDGLNNNNNNELESSNSLAEKLSNKIKLLEAENKRLRESSVKQSKVMAQLVARLESVDPEFETWSDVQLVE